jgi:hypothetical protein
VVLFEEALPEAKLRHLDEQLSRGFDMTFSFGATGSFSSIADQPRPDSRTRPPRDVRLKP